MPNIPVSRVQSLKKIEKYKNDENEERGNWSSQLDFVLACLGYAVGLGNVWRFPFKCYENGGGAFIVAYVCMLMVVGLPIFFLELVIGQFSSLGTYNCWGFAPIISGIGFSMMMISFLTALYYNLVIAWAIRYLFISFQNPLPWSHCNNDFNTKYCSDKLKIVKCEEEDLFKADNGTCFNITFDPSQMIGLWDTNLAQDVGIKRVSAPEEFFKHGVLKRSSGIDDIGDIHWELVISLLIAWILVFASLSKGIKTSGKVVYFTALFPYLILVILLGKAATLNGHLEGIKFYIVPDFAQLGNIKIWKEAAVQIFFSLSTGYGGLITLASYNRFQNNILRDALIVTLGNSLTSIFAGFAIFGFLGFIAEELGVEVKDVVTGGSGLAFIAYPEAVTKLPSPNVWAILFFAMIITLGIDSQLTYIETLATSILDKYTHLREASHRVYFSICIVSFLIGLIFCTESGLYWMELLDQFVGSWNLFVIGMLECIGIAWLYGWPRVEKDIEVMIGKKPSIFWKIMWKYVSPVALTILTILAWSEVKPPTVGDYTFPGWANGLGWALVLTTVVLIPGRIAAIYVSDIGTPKERFKRMLKATKEWGPALVRYRNLITYVEGFWYGEEKDAEKQQTKVIEIKQAMKSINAVKRVSSAVDPPAGK